MKYKGRELEKGEKVKIFKLDETEVSGKYIEDIDVLEEVPLVVHKSPSFKMEDGNIIHGYECWWIPEKEALEAEKIVKEKKERKV